MYSEKATLKRRRRDINFQSHYILIVLSISWFFDVSLVLRCQVRLSEAGAWKAIRTTLKTPSRVSKHQNKWKFSHRNVIKRHLEQQSVKFMFHKVWATQKCVRDGVRSSASSRGRVTQWKIYTTSLWRCYMRCRQRWKWKAAVLSQWRKLMLSHYSTEEKFSWKISLVVFHHVTCAAFSRQQIYSRKFRSISTQPPASHHLLHLFSVTCVNCSTKKSE